MIDVKQKLIDVLTVAGYVEGQTLFLHNAMPEDMPYPHTFVTFRNTETTNTAHYDNNVFTTVWGFYINVYSCDPRVVNTELLRLIPLLKQVGFIPIGKGSDADSDEKSHTGRSIDIQYIEINDIENQNIISL